MRAVSIVRRGLDGIKTGHAETLDPLADGVLVLACGKAATKSIPHFMGTDKRYQTLIDLQAFTATDDTQADPEPVEVFTPPTDVEIDERDHVPGHHHANPARVQRDSRER